MRRLNLRLTAAVLVAAAVLAGGMHLLHGYQMQRNARMFLREAEKAKTEGNRPEAVRQLRNYLDFVPNDVEAVADLAVLLADLSESEPGALRPAYEALEKALRLDPTRIALRRRLVPIAVTIGRPTDAHEHLERYLLPASPKDPELLLLSGRAQDGMGKYADAAKAYQQVITLAPERLEAYQRLADVLQRRLEKPADAEAVMARLVAANPEASEAHLACGQFLLERWSAKKDDTARLEQAAAEAAAALALVPESAEALYLSAQCALEKKDYDAARASASALVKRYPESAAVYSLLADLEARTGKRSEAIAWLRQGIEAAPEERELVWNLGNLLIEDGQIDEARDLAVELRDTQYPPPLVNYLLARVEFAREQWLVASREFERLRPELTAWPSVVKQVDFWLGGCYRQLGNADLQLTAYRRALGVDPFWIPARAGVASALLSLRRIEEAQEEYRELMRIAGNPAAGVLDLAQLEIIRNLWANRAQRKWTEAERLIDLAEEAVPGNPRIPVLRAELLVGQDRAAEAEQLLAAARTEKPDEITYHVALTALADRERDWARAETYLAEAQQQFGDRVELRLARAQHLVQQLGTEAAEPLRGLAENSEAFTPAERGELWRGLAAASLQVGDHEQTRRLCQQVSQAEPHNLQIRLLLFDLALRAEDDSGLEGVLKEIHEIEGEGAFWHYGTALHLGLKAKGDPRQLDEALGHLAKCRAARPGWSRVPLLAAEFHALREDEDLAIENYLQAVELGERSPRAIRHAVQLLADRQRYLEADQVLRKLEEQQSPFSTDLSRMASEVSLRLDDFDRALELAKQAARDSKEYRDHVWLGQVLSVLAQRARSEQRTAEADQMLAEAEEEFRQAVTLAESATDAWVMLVQFLARTGQLPKAEAALAEARAKIPAEHAPLALAQCYEAMGNAELAEKEYLAAIAAAPDNVRIVRQLVEFYLRTGKSREAETHLRKITSGQLAAGEVDQVWSRRALALILQASGTYENLQQGLALVEENLRVPNPAIQDQRAKALLLSRHPKREKRNEAAEIFERVVQDRQVATPDDRFVLAKLYLSQGPAKWGQAARHFRTLLGASPEEPRYVSTYGAALLARGETDEAEMRVNWLEKIASGQLTTVSLRAQIHCQRGSPAQAIAVLQEYLAKPESQGEDRAMRIGLVAAIFEDLSRRLMGPGQQEGASQLAAEAEKLYRQYTDLVPEQKLLLAGFLARQRRLDEALTLAEGAVPTASPDLIATTMVSLMGAEGPSASPDSRCEKLLLAAMAQHDRPVPFLLVLADYYSIHNRCDEAEAVYREILQKDPNSDLALNNLAVLLALEKKNLEEAEQLVDRAIELTGPKANSLDSRALVYLTRGKALEALVDIEAVIADAPVAAAYYRRAQILLALNRRAEAKQALQTARDKGLKAELLHPLEGPTFAELCRTML